MSLTLAGLNGVLVCGWDLRQILIYLMIEYMYLLNQAMHVDSYRPKGLDKYVVQSFS